MKYQEMMIKWVICLVTAGFLFTFESCSRKSKNSDYNSDSGRTVTFTNKVSFVAANGDTVSTVNVAVAKTPEERDTGLMDVKQLPDDGGMLFIFDKTQNLSFWMANTPLSLDIIFINADKKVIRIHHSTQPFSEKQLNSDGPAKYVVEVNGGYCVDHDVTEGMNVAF
jgi:uncharacterized membrane protein (UPF0127 family)